MAGQRSDPLCLAHDPMVASEQQTTDSQELTVLTSSGLHRLAGSFRPPKHLAVVVAMRLWMLFDS